MATINKSIDQALSQRIIQLGIDLAELDNGNWAVVVNGTRLRGVTAVDPGTNEPKLQGVIEDHRMGPVAHLKDFSDVENRVRIELATDQQAVLSALLGPQAAILGKLAANAANVVGDPSKCATPEALAVADIGHLVLAKVNDDSGSFSMTVPRQLRPDVDTSAGGYRFSIYNAVDGRFHDIEEVAGIGGTLAWGANPYIGEFSCGGMTLSGEIFVYDPSQAYTVNCTDGIELAVIPEWLEGARALSAGDFVVILNCSYKYMQFGTDTSQDSYQINYPFNANERVFLELYRMLGDAPGGRGHLLKRRVYFLAKPIAPPTEKTEGRDGTPTSRSIEFATYPDVSKFGDGSPFVDQKFIFTTT